MTFDVYPDQHQYPLSLSRGERLLQPFAERASLDPATGRTVMYLAVVKLGTGCAAPGGPDPVIRLKVDGGPVAEIGTQTRLYDGQGRPEPVAVATLTSAGGVLVVEVEVLRPRGTWHLGLEHAGPEATHSFTWVVADNLAEVRQPWIHVSPDALDYAVQPLETQRKIVTIVNRGTGPLRLMHAPGFTDYLGAFTLESVTPPAIEPHQCAQGLVAFKGPLAVGTSRIDLRLGINDSTATPGGGHNNLVRLTATTALAAPPPVVSAVEPAYGHSGEEFTIFGRNLVVRRGDDVTIEFESLVQRGSGDGPGDVTRATVRQPTSSRSVTAYVADVDYTGGDSDYFEVSLVRKDGQLVKVHDQFEVLYL